MGLYTQLPDNIEEVDVIVVGGGTAGCIVASRLAEADPGLSILVIEGGPNNYDMPTIIHPIFFLTHLMPGSKTTLFYKAKAEKQLAEREPVVVPCGGVLGGGSSINLLMYSRGQRIDFDAWQTPGWFANDMVPYLKKLETYHAPSTNNLHGSDGPVHVSRGTYHALGPENDFISALNKKGIPETEDLQNLEGINAVQRAFRFVSPDGKRQDTAHRYLHPLLQDNMHPNLHVLVESQVIRIIFDGDTASGVVFQPNIEFQPEAEDASIRTVRARKSVVAACGALGTPPLLERSGLGDPEVLKKAGVPVVASIPGVGHQYEDHHLLTYSYKTALNPGETVDEILQGRIDPGELIKKNDKILGWNAQDVTCKLRPADSEVAALGPEFQAAWDQDFKNAPTKPLMLMTLINGYPGDPSGIPPGQYLGLSAFSPYPYSRGHVHITGPELSDPLDFETGFFSDTHDIDLKKHVWAYKTQREFMRRMETYRGEVASLHPPFPPQSDAACIEINGPLGDVSDIHYTDEDDAIIEKWLREHVGSTWHSLGTCKMRPREEMGVVDPSLNVYGVQGLKIADLSIVPRNIGANTNNTALAIGEKAADILVKELGL